MTSSQSQAPAVPTSNPWAVLTQAVALLALSAAGVTDGALPVTVRAVLPPAVALVLAVLALAHHQTVQGAQAVLADLGQTAAAVASAPAAIPQGIRVTAANFDAVSAAVGAYVESTRLGVPAVGPAGPVNVSGRHSASQALPSADLTPTAPVPVVDPILAGLPPLPDDTQAIPMIPPVPVSPAGYAPTNGVLR